MERIERIFNYLKMDLPDVTPKTMCDSCVMLIETKKEYTREEIRTLRKNKYGHLTAFLHTSGWTEFTAYFYCKNCLNILREETYYPPDDESISEIMLVHESEFETIQNQLILFLYGKKMSAAWDALKTDTELYVYKKTANLLKESISDKKLLDLMNENNRIKYFFFDVKDIFSRGWFSNAWDKDFIQRIKIKESSLKIDIKPATDDLSGWVDGEQWYFEKEDILSIELYDIFTNSWIPKEQFQGGNNVERIKRMKEKNVQGIELKKQDASVSLQDSIREQILTLAKR